MAREVGKTLGILLPQGTEQSWAYKTYMEACEHMAREMTPQERAADVIETWKTYDPTGFRIGHLTQLIEGAIKQTRRAALLECANKVKDRAALWRSHGGAKIGFPYGHLTVEDECDSIADELHRLAQEG